jgi:hypothetical protein
MNHQNTILIVCLMGILTCHVFFRPAFAAEPTDVPLVGVTQNWDKKLSADDSGNPCNSSRFTCIFPDAIHPDGAAARDNETGLVWERSPAIDLQNWSSAIGHCANREIGGRKGWHLPIREQLASLVDTTTDNPTLPIAHPFLNIQSADFWSSSTDVNNPTVAWDVRFGNGAVGSSNKIFMLRAWCVRGGQIYEGPDVLNVVPGS